MKVAPGSRNEKKSPAFCGALGFRADDFFELLGSAAKKETLLVRSNPSSPNAGFERSSGASLTLCFGPSSPSRLPSPLLCLGIASHEAIAIAYKRSKWRACGVALDCKQGLMLQCGKNTTAAQGVNAAAL
jgi:hypothetical protein